VRSRATPGGRCLVLRQPHAVGGILKLDLPPVKKLAGCIGSSRTMRYDVVHGGNSNPSGSPPAAPGLSPAFNEMQGEPDGKNASSNVILANGFARLGAG
jgi:hypothetical protein